MDNIAQPLIIKQRLRDYALDLLVTLPLYLLMQLFFVVAALTLPVEDSPVYRVAQITIGVLIIVLAWAAYKLTKLIADPKQGMLQLHIFRDRLVFKNPESNVNITMQKDDIKFIQWNLDLPRSAIFSEVADC